MRSTIMLLVTLLVAAPAGAQGTMEPEADAADAVAGVRWLHETAKRYVTASAEQAGQELHDYRATDEVRTFGQILGHIANSQYMFCSSALGEESPNEANFEELTSKAELAAALAASFDYCERAYAMDSEAALAQATVFGQERTRLFALEFNVAHNFEHYGNLVTYMRLNGMVPPSSQR